MSYYNEKEINTGNEAESTWADGDTCQESDHGYTQLPVLKKTDWITSTYTFTGGFMVDIVENSDSWECYLYHELYGIKSSMFGIPKGSYVSDLAGVEELVAANLIDQPYIELYREEYMD